MEDQFQSKLYKSFEFVFESVVVMLNDYHFCPTFMMNVISIGLLAKAGYEILIKENYCDVILNDIIVELWKVYIKFKWVLIMCKHSIFNSFNLAKYQEWIIEYHVKYLRNL